MTAAFRACFLSQRVLSTPTTTRCPRTPTSRTLSVSASKFDANETERNELEENGKDNNSRGTTTERPRRFSGQQQANKKSEVEKEFEERAREIANVLRRYSKPMNVSLLPIAERKAQNEKMMARESFEYHRGKRFLANMMGENPFDVTQEDINKSISYLFPSGLFEKKARPMMKPPEELFPPIPISQLDSDGRPFNSLFFTRRANYYTIMHEIYSKILELEAVEDENLKGNRKPTEKLELGISTYIKINELEVRTNEPITEHEYARFIRLLDKLVENPYSYRVKDFIMQYRIAKEAFTQELVPEIQYDENGRAYSVANGMRKHSLAEVTLKNSGSGKIQINGRDLLDEFYRLVDRDQIMFPLSLLCKLGQFDISCTVVEGGPAARAGAIRLAMSRALCSFIQPEQREILRQAGLLTHDHRYKERYKPGQWRARKQYVWKAR